MSQYVERLVVSDDAGQWNVSCDANGTSCHQTLRTANGVIVGFVVDHRRDYSEPDTRASARRLVACWNACEGLPTEVLEHAASTGDSLGGHIKLTAQRDELLAALKRVVQADDACVLRQEDIERARAAIAKAEGTTP